jgi:hypothetical protein
MPTFRLFNPPSIFEKPSDIPLYRSRIGTRVCSRRVRRQRRLGYHGEPIGLEYQRELGFECNRRRFRE